MKDIVLVLPDIRSVHNVGSIFRTADAVRVSHIYVCGYTPTPLDRFGRPRRDMHKAALGAEETVSWSHHENVSSVLTKVRADGYQVIAVEQAENSEDYTAIAYADKVALIFGNEVGGIPNNICQLADVVAEIPMLGEKESLNISVSVGVMAYHLRSL